MKTITIKNGQHLRRTEFSDLKDLQQELILTQKKFKLSSIYKSILKHREKLADQSPKDGISWNELLNQLKRKNA